MPQVMLLRIRIKDAPTHSNRIISSLFRRTLNIELLPIDQTDFIARRQFMLPNPQNLPCNCNWRVISLVLKGLTFYVLTYHIANVGLLIIKTTLQPQSVIFSVKGQIVIPRQLRKEFGIEAGTRAVFDCHG